ncbi:histone deacetylase complex subunit SAP130-A, partial [Trichonephila clavata]
IGKILGFSKLNMNNQKIENKSTDHEEGDHTQPINLVAARTVAPATTFTGANTGASSQPLAMRPHIEAPKQGLMTLYFRTPTPRPQGQVMGPVVGTQVSSTQHFTTKQAQDFKNSGISSWTVIRMPTSDITQAGTNTPSSSGALTQGILPSALSGGNRHMIPAGVHPVIAAGNSGPSMASIIRSSHQIPPSGHVIHQQSFSSHVPRGPAAVASISAAPKSAVATPILRAPHSSTTMALASSSMMALHAPVRAKSPTLVSRTATPPVGSGSLPQVIDLQKTHSLSSSTTHIGLGSRAIDGSVVRTGPSHSSSITIAKPINISQPIVQHLQQVYDKGNLKPVSNIPSTANSTSNSTPAHQAVPPSGFTSVSENVGVVPTISRSVNSSGYSTSIMQLSPAAVGQSLQTLRATHVNSTMHSNVSSSVAPHQTLVISAKSLMPANHSIALATTSARSVTPSSSVSVSGNISAVPSLSSRPNSINPTAIPVAKVYPQSPITSRAISEPSIPDNARVGNYSSQSSNSVRATTSSTTAPQSVMLTEKQGESNPSIRFTSLSKPQVGSSATYAPSPTTYLYHDQYPNLAMHPYTTNPSSGGFASTQLRPVSFSQHSSSNTSSHSSASTNPVQPISSVMVAVDSRHHVALHPSYGGKNADISNAPLPSNGGTPIGQATVVTTTYNSQGNVNNHTSPRPSILRKRTSESLNTVVKKNLSNNMCINEPISPRSDINSNPNFTSVLSPKPNSEKPKENIITMIGAPSDSHNVTSINSCTIKKEPGISENACHNLEGAVKDMRIVEASPRKKPRKQLLAANELMETHSSEGDENNFDSKVRIKDEHDEEKRYVTFYKRPSMSLLSSYRQTWKARLNHFARYSDVKPKEEKKLTVNELANQKGILQQANGWKIYHLSAQMEEIIELEETVYSRLSHLLEVIEKDPKGHRNRNSSNSDEDRIINKLTDLIKGNLQRSKIVQEQVAESKSQAIKVLDHKTNVTEMVNKYISRRPLKKKDKS